MQGRLPFVAPSSRPRVLTVGLHSYDVEIVRHRLARRYVLRVGRDGQLRLTVPRGASIEAGLAFARRQAAWIERERARHAERGAAWRAGTIVWFRGERLALSCAAGQVAFGAERCAITSQDLRHDVEAHLTALARRELPAQCLALAAAHGVTVARVHVRNQRSRWGACSARRVITLNWRLVQMPPSVAEYVILHELMHLRQPNHSRRFWREVDGVCPWWRDAERWIRKHGKEIL